MTDTITPASLRAHADWMVQRDEYWLGSTASMLRMEAARLEAESARDEEARKYAMRLGAQARLAFATVKGSLKEVNFAAGEHILAVLAADGRLLPEGGAVLTEEQVADLWWLMAQYVGFNGDIDCPPYASLDALFTPPAAPVPDSRVHNHGPAEGRGLDCPERMVDGQLRGVCMDSGPDGTPEKPWPTWQDVPEGVRYCSRKQRHHRWVNRNGERFTVAFSNDNEHPAVADEKTMKLRAPFVRVDGDKE